MDGDLAQRFKGSIEWNECSAFEKSCKASVNTLIGIGSFGHVGHCFVLGCPKRMILFDPQWTDSAIVNAELKEIQEFSDPGTLIAVDTSNALITIVKFFFQGLPKVIELRHEFYSPEILITVQPDVFHMGHRSVTITNDDMMQTLAKLPLDSIIVNLLGQSDIKDMLIVNFFLDKITEYYPDKPDPNDYCIRLIVRKSRDISLKELKIMWKIGQLCNNFNTENSDDEMKKINENTGISLEELHSFNNESRDCRIQLQKLNKSIDKKTRAKIMAVLENICRNHSNLYKNKKKIEELKRIFHWF